MSSLKQIVFVLLVAFSLVTNKTFSQKKNSLVYQNGIVNYFYDNRPVILNVVNLQYINNPLRIPNGFFIKSRGINYTRYLNEKSNVTLFGAFFDGAFVRNGLERDNSLLPLITARRWYLNGLEYNRKLIEKSKLKLFYGAGLNYRKGIEIYKVLQIGSTTGFGESISEVIRVQHIGASLNLNMRYNFWKRFFFYSKIDFKAYFYQMDAVTYNVNELNDKWETREFESPKKFIHTLTIGIGVDF